jgi:hypothetical protein
LDKWDAVQEVLSLGGEDIRVTNDIDKPEGDYEVRFKMKVPSDWPDWMREALAEYIDPDHFGE